MSHDALATTWFVLLGVLLAGYAVLDGFDLGVGILHPFVARDDRERRLVMNAIGPLWDGNEVWLVTFGGALFAAFPDAYATVFSAFYTPFVVLLFALILRAVSLEFRSKRPGRSWRAFWDWCFFAGSLSASVLFGVAVGNVVLGLPLDAAGDFTGGLADLLRPYPLGMGVLVACLFAMHGSIFLYLKTEGALQARLHRQVWRTFGLFLVAYMLLTIVTLVQVPHVVEAYERWPWAWAAPVLAVLALANVPRSLFQDRPGQAFVSSCAVIVALVGLLGLALHPDLVVSRPAPENGLSIRNAASSATTLRIMLTIAAVGMPFVVGYTAAIYWAFRGKVKLDEHGY